MNTKAKFRLFHEVGHFWSEWMEHDQFLAVLKEVGTRFTAVETRQLMTREELVKAGLMPKNDASQHKNN
jgi:hypothetical protein